MRIAVDDAEWAEASKPVQDAGREALRALERQGATLVPVHLELARYAAAIGYMSIGPESLAELRREWATSADDMSPDLQVTFAALCSASAGDYIDGQRLREGLRLEAAKMFEDVDLLALPATVETATRASDAEMSSGFLDSRVLAGLCRFMFFGNLTGLPAASCPVGLDAKSLPIGLQLVGDAWDEATVLAALAELERTGAARARRPAVGVDILRSARESSASGREKG